MSFVNVVNMVVLDNPTLFVKPFQFEVTFECLQALEDDLEWKVVYVGNAEDASFDQVLDEVLVGPVPVGRNKFLLQAEAPSLSQLDAPSILGVTVVLISCSYRGREFVRIGYYVNNEDPTTAAVVQEDKEAKPNEGKQQQQQQEQEGDKKAQETNDKKQDENNNDDDDLKDDGKPQPTPPKRPLDISKVIRHIMADKPRVTKIPINWTAPEGQEEGEAGAAGEGEPAPLSPSKQESQAQAAAADEEEEEEDALAPVPGGGTEVDEEEYEDEEENPEEVDLEAEDEEEEEEEEEEDQDEEGEPPQDAGKRPGDPAAPPSKKAKTG